MAPVLTLLNGIEGFAIYSDASKLGLGCVLMQNRKVVVHASRQLKIHKRNYATHDLEVVVVLFALKIWCHYLYVMDFEVFIDYNASNTSSLKVT